MVDYKFILDLPNVTPGSFFIFGIEDERECVEGKVAVKLKTKAGTITSEIFDIQFYYDLGSKSKTLPHLLCEKYKDVDDSLEFKPLTRKEVISLLEVINKESLKALEAVQTEMASRSK